ncbi:hypothetical protein K435DRAFT_875647 [Dendrothele bispora CBS 962.96]|uniref:Uncharacterized protein n=1 Tax=Dendrothele bispora (strain CBS 962.96) TaxID=1314807 RepID=A0A4S8KU36_DENBC|nr:hypothetical protein K435DRAFT_875647 [Dendrothele bispora CBS 962.96]
MIVKLKLKGTPPLSSNNEYLITPTLELPIQPTAFDFESALLQSIQREGASDFLDEDTLDAPSYSSPPSPLSSLPPSLDSTPAPSPTSSCAPTPHFNASASTTTLSNTKKRKVARSKAASKRNKRRKHEAKNRAGNTVDQPSVPAKYLSNMQAKTSTFEFEMEACITSTGYIGIADRQHQEVTPSLDEVVGPGSKYGMDLCRGMVSDRTPIPIVSPQDGQIYALLAGSPADENWKEVADVAVELLETKHEKISPSKNQCRGWFTAANYRIFHGRGGVKPSNLIHTKTSSSILESLCLHWSFKCLSTRSLNSPPAHSSVGLQMDSSPSMHITLLTLMRRLKMME